MVQIGNFHIGRYDSAHPPIVSTGEAFSLWDNLVARYDLDDSLEIFLNYAHDDDLRHLIEKIIKILRKQTVVLEEQLAIYKLPLPQRPREIIEFAADSGVIKDEFIFRRILSGLQDFLTICSVGIRNSVVNDAVRDLLIKLLMEKIDELNELCIFGKKKGWLELPPTMKIC